jgi:trk system potassium uptake protein TrkA
MLRRLLPSGAQEEWRDPSGSIVLAEIDYSELWIGQRMSRLERQAGVRIALVTRYGDSVLPTAETVVQDGDLIHAVVPLADIERVAEVFARGPEGN